MMMRSLAFVVLLWQFISVYSQCTAGQYKSGSTCSACGNGGANYTCTPGNYQNGNACDGTGNKDTQTCKGCTACNAGNYQSGTPCTGNTTSDTQQCQKCTTCSGGNYVTGTPCDGSGTSDTQTCTACKSCTMGQYTGGTPCNGKTTSDTQTCTACGNGGASYSCASGNYKSGSACPGNGNMDTQKCSTCTQVMSCFSGVTCTDPSNSVCGGCIAGYYLSGGQCMACSSVQNCFSGVSCTGPSDSKCNGCAPGYYLSGGTCLACTPIASCTSGVTCTSSVLSICSSCSPGYFLSGGKCTACTLISQCASVITCTTSSDSLCSQCNVGYYLASGGGQCSACSCPATYYQSQPCLGTATTNSPGCAVCGCNSGQYITSPCLGTEISNSPGCSVCTPITGCTSNLLCTGANDTKCTQCIDGYYLVKGNNGEMDSCQQCPLSVACASTITCTDSTSSKCYSCISGYYLDNTTSSCKPCVPVSNCISPVQCTTASDSTCQTCNTGFYLTQRVNASVCQSCPSIPGCFSIVTCSDAVDASCSLCNNGFSRELKVGAPDTCVLNTTCSFENWSPWSNCSLCSGATQTRFRNIAKDNQALPSYCAQDLFDNRLCGFPCLDTGITTGAEAILWLYTALSQYDWLQRQFDPNILNISSIVKSPPSIIITCDRLSSKRAITNYTCENDPYIVNMSNVAVNTTYTYLPNFDSTNKILPPVITTANHSSACLITIAARPDASFPVGAVIGPIIAFLFILLAVVGYILWKSKQLRWLNYLPKELHFHWTSSRRSARGWVKRENLYTKKISAGSKKWDLFEGIWTMLCPDGLNVKEVHQLNNPTLGAFFANHISLLQKRMREAPALFQSKKWQATPDVELRNYTMDKFKMLTGQYPWNYNIASDCPTPIVYAAHGTEFSIGMTIGANGFAALSTLDDGFYGKGIYFTSHALYTIPYCGARKEPAILVCLLSMGNPYPVVEHPTKHEKPLKGQALAGGYQSNFAVVGKDGFPVSDPKSVAEFDEIVIGQEAQVVPVYLVKLGETQNLLKLWTAPMDYRENRHSFVKKESSTKNLFGMRHNDNDLVGLTGSMDDQHIPLNPIWTSTDEKL